MSRIIFVATNAAAAIINTHPDVLAVTGGPPLTAPLGVVDGRGWTQTHLASGFDDVEFTDLLVKAAAAGYDVSRLASNSDVRKGDPVAVFDVDVEDHYERIRVAMGLVFDPALDDIDL